MSDMDEKEKQGPGSSETPAPAHPYSTSPPETPREAAAHGDDASRATDASLFGRHSLQLSRLPWTAAASSHQQSQQEEEEKKDGGETRANQGGRPPNVIFLDEIKSCSVPDNLNNPSHRAGNREQSATPATTPVTPRAQRTPRPSHDFDRRYDGPFGRPSLVMARRGSRSPGLTPREGDQNTADIPPARTAFEPTPPPLNYTLRTRKRAIIIFWTLIIVDSVVTPIALYFGLWYGVGPGTNTPTEKHQKLSPNAVFSIVTAALGGISIIDYVRRFWRLWRKGSTCRVIGARRWYLDWFQWHSSVAWVLILLELIIGTIPANPPIRLLSMPLATMLFVFGTELLVVDLLRALHVPAPCRISSVPKGAQLRPGIYSLVEDVCAVDGSGGTDFRVALDRRYEASHLFRAMLRRLGAFWALGAEACAVATTVLVFTLPRNAAYSVGWSLPFAWAGVWAAATFWYVQRELAREARAWAEEAALKEASGGPNVSSASASASAERNEAEPGSIEGVVV